MGKNWWRGARWGVCVLAICLLPACGGNPEERAAIDNLNNHPEIIQRGGVVKEIEMREAQRGGVYPFRADVLDDQGNTIGTVNGARVEGFGTRVNRIRWVGEEGERRGRGQGGPRRQGDGNAAAE